MQSPPPRTPMLIAGCLEEISHGALPRWHLCLDLWSLFPWKQNQHSQFSPEERIPGGISSQHLLRVTTSGASRPIPKVEQPLYPHTPHPAPAAGPRGLAVALSAERDGQKGTWSQRVASQPRCSSSLKVPTREHQSVGDDMHFLTPGAPREGGREQMVNKPQLARGKVISLR